MKPKECKPVQVQVLSKNIEIQNSLLNFFKYTYQKIPQYNFFSYQYENKYKIGFADDTSSSYMQSCSSLWLRNRARPNVRAVKMLFLSIHIAPATSAARYENTLLTINRGYFPLAFVTKFRLLSPAFC